MNAVSSQTLSEIVDVIVHEVQPEKIILFGSQVKGEVHEESDIDMLIVDSQSFGPDRCRRKESARIWKSIRKFPYPVDILLYTRHELAARKHSINNVAAIAMREGKILYEKN